MLEPFHHPSYGRRSGFRCASGASHRRGAAHSRGEQSGCQEQKRELSYSPRGSAALRAPQGVRPTWRVSAAPDRRAAPALYRRRRVSTPKGSTRTGVVVYAPRVLLSQGAFT